jgi:hypothetical protein
MTPGNLQRRIGIEAGEQPEAFAIEQHVRRKSSLPAKIVAMRPPPGGKRAVALAFLEGEGRVDLIEAPLCQLDRLDHRYRDTGAVQHDPLLADTCLLPLARRPAGRPLCAGQHQLGELVGQFGAVAERELFERMPVRVALFHHHLRRALAILTLKSII